MRIDRKHRTSVDRSAIEGLRALSDANQSDLLTDLIDLFLGSAPREFALLTKAFAANDHKLVAKASHRLKSRSLSLGAHELGTLCACIELQARQGEWSGQEAAWLSTLESEFENVRAELASIKIESASRRAA